MKIGYAFCGSFCTHARSLEVFSHLAKKHELCPIVSTAVATTDTRFGSADTLLARLTEISGREVIDSIVSAEPLGPKSPLDALIIAPCTGNTLAKLAAGITDTPVTMAAKAHLRCDRPLVIALATNDALSANLKNIATMMEKKNVFFVPLSQDDPVSKPHSLVCDFSLIEPTLSSAMNGKQYQRVIM